MARVEIEDGLAEPVTSEERTSFATGLTLRWSVKAFAAGVMLAAVVVWRITAGGPETVLRLERFALMLPAGDRLSQDSRNSGLALSPDGQTIVYVAFRGAAAGRLFRRDLDALEARPIAGTERARWPFCSPDGTSVGFFAATSSGLMVEGNPRSHAMSPGGRLAVLTIDENASQRHIDTVQNWFEDLKRLVPRND